jgi:ABC-2 type transport system ATP-binding protein
MDALPLSVRNVTKYFGGGPRYGRLLPRLLGGGRFRADGRVQVLHGVSLDVRRGEIFGLIGANGSGKSTLIRILSTLLLPDGGAVRVFGFDVVRQEDRVRALINRVSADPSFFRSMSAMENLLFFGRVYGVAPPRIKRLVPEILERLGFEAEKARVPMSHLSRGQQQKIAVARSFLTAPSLMLLDEPTTGLDPRSKRDVQAFISEVRRDHDATILLTTHDMEEAELLCDRIAFIASGRIVAEGTSRELCERVANGRPLETVNMETVFMELTGRRIEDDEVPEEAGVSG